MPKVSVIMPAYNAEKYIAEAIDSILNQTFSDFEFIIIDDGSKDNTVEIIKSYSDKRIRFYQNEHNMGVAATLNRGLDLATGEYIARMDSDDISLPQRFGKQVSYLEANPDIAVIATNVKNFGAESEAWPSSATNDALKVDMLFNCCICHPTVMMRNSVMKKEHFHYDEFFDHMEDYELWDRIIQKYDFACLQGELYMYRIHESQVTQIKNDNLSRPYFLLKQRIAERLDIDTLTEDFACFVNYCYGIKPEEKKSRESVRKVLMQISENNKLKNIYNQELLDNSVCSVALSTYDKKSEKRSFLWANRKMLTTSFKSKISLIIRIVRI